MAKLEDPELLRDLYVTQRLDTGDIATHLGVGYNTVVRALAKYGIKKEHRFPAQFTDEQHSVLYGSMLGDGNLSIQKNGVNACLRIEHSTKQEAWLRWKFEHFKPWINASEPTFQLQKAVKGVGAPSVKFTTVSAPIFTKVYHDFYIDGKKIITKKVMDKVDALALAVWFQDDGSYYGNTLKLATQGFTKFEQEILCAYFRTKWSINPNITSENNGDKYLYHLKFGKSDAENFVGIIRPFVIPSLAYKLDPRSKKYLESSS